MAWNDKGGPWGPPPGGNEPRRPPPGNGQPDFEAMLRKGQDRMRELWPSGFGGGRGILLIVLALILIWLATGIYRVNPNEQAVVQRFGKWVRTETLGLHYHLPSPIETATLVDVTQRHQTEVGGRATRDAADTGTMLTGDRNILELDFVIVWQVRDPVKYLFSVAEPQALLRRAAESAMREVIGQSEVMPALNEARRQNEIAAAVILQATMDRYDSGIQIASVLLQKVDPPMPVVDAFNDVQRARSELEQSRNEAEKYQRDIIPRARGDAQKLIQDAQAYKERVVAESTGEAQQFTSVLESYRKSRDVTAKRLYIETMEQVLQKARKIVIDPDVKGVVPYLPLPGLAAPKTGQ